MNAIGLGKLCSDQGANNAMDGISLLSPSVSKNVNFSNPSTWHKLKFTYLSLSFDSMVDFLVTCLVLFFVRKAHQARKNEIF